MCCDCVTLYLSHLSFFIWRSEPALTWDFVLQTECPQQASLTLSFTSQEQTHSTQPGSHRGSYFLATAS